MRFIVAFVAALFLMSAIPSVAGSLSNAEIKAFTKLYGRAFADKEYACLYDAVNQGLSIKQAVEFCRIELDGFGIEKQGIDPRSLGTFGLGTSNITSPDIVGACKNVDRRYAVSPTIASWVSDWIRLNGTSGKGDVTPSSTDAGKPDAGKPDAGKPDAGKPDAGKPDAGKPDAGKPDAGKPDAGKPDPGKPDAGKPDAGKPDGGTPDSGQDKSDKAKLDEAWQKQLEHNLGEELEEMTDLFGDGTATPKTGNDGKQMDGGADAGHTVEESTCEFVLAEAREKLRQCQLRQSKSHPDCAKLAGECPPDLIHVDPEQGFTCTPTYDHEGLKEAYVKLCKETAMPGPDGQSPCEKTELHDGYLVLSNSASDVCNSGNPKAYIDPSSDICFMRLGSPKLPKIPGNSLEEWIAILVDKFGGPIFVLPVRGPDPRPPR